MNTVKTNIQNLAMLSSVIAFASCQQQPKTADQPATEVTSVHTTAPDSIGSNSQREKESRTISGKVLEIQNGKDGYTAKMETDDKSIYFATISHSNLKDHSQYRSVKIGDQIKVSGDYWLMETQQHLTVRELQ